ncbi:MAG: DUF4426 domain-containing protein, partial [Porticoccaceae bacterium]|nr:DUF4426 domain-containing protein [Porticoccaceae bacterium]
MHKLLTLLVATLLSVSVLAASDSYKVHNGNKIYYSAFNSSFLQPDTAAAYDIIRAKNRGLVNIAV